MTEKINLDKFMAKSKEIEIEGTIFKIEALTLEDSSLLVGLDKPEEAGNAMKEIIKRILKFNFPEITEEEIKKFAFRYIEPLMNAFGEVNNIEQSKITPALKARIEQMKK